MPTSTRSPSSSALTPARSAASAWAYRFIGRTVAPARLPASLGPRCRSPACHHGEPCLPRGIADIPFRAYLLPTRARGPLLRRRAARGQLAQAASHLARTTSTSVGATAVHSLLRLPLTGISLVSKAYCFQGRSSRRRPKWTGTQDGPPTRRMRSSSRRSRLLGRPAPRVHSIPGGSVSTGGGGLWSR